MPENWDRLSGYERAQKILENVEGLTNEMIQSVYDEWSELEFEKTGFGIIRSEVVLQEIAMRHLLQKQNRWGDVEQRRREQLLSQVEGLEEAEEYVRLNSAP